MAPGAATRRRTTAQVRDAGARRAAPGLTRAAARVSSARQQQAKASRRGGASGRECALGGPCDDGRRDRERARRGVSARASSNEEEADSDVVEFGYNRKDVIIICTVPLVGGFLTYYGLQKFLGLNPIEAGNYVQVIFVFILCVGWCATYLFRVGTKNMTYTQQLKDYEEAVMAKRLEEMSDSEIDDILSQAEGKTPEEIYRENSSNQQ